MVLLMLLWVDLGLVERASLTAEAIQEKEGEARTGIPWYLGFAKTRIPRRTGAHCDGADDQSTLALHLVSV